MQENATIHFEKYKEKLIREIFIDTADEDYVIARWLFLNHMFRQFFWSAAQALEKYFKAVLLIDGHSVKEYNHKLDDLFTDVKKYNGGTIPDNLMPPIKVSLFFDASWGDWWGNSSANEFVHHIHENGIASNRYDYFGIKQECGDLYKLDQLVYALRDILVKRIGNAGFNIRLKTFGGVCNSLFENNFSFAPEELEHEELRMNSTYTVTSLKILYKNDILNANALKNWVRENIKIKDGEIKRLQM